MLNLKKISQVLTNPVFYRKKVRELLRRFRSFEDAPKWTKVVELGPIKRAVVVIAHPDDETFCSGLICDLIESGSHVDVVCVTRGEGGATGGHPRKQLGEVRSAELKNACGILGVSGIHFLDHVDPLGGEYRAWAPDVTVAKLADQLASHLADADLVISHGSCGEYWHPAHLLVYEAVMSALDAAPGPGWLTVMARNRDFAVSELVNWDDEANLRIDVSRHAEKRLEALSCHQTQLDLFQRWIKGTAEKFVQAVPLESYCLQENGKLQVAKTADVGESQGNQ